MTTPERLRRRQRAEGAILILLAIFTVLQAIYFNEQDQRQRQCIHTEVANLSESLNARAELVRKESEASQRNWLVYAEAAGLIKDPAHPKLDKADQERLNKELVAALLNYKKVIAEVQKEREENPIPVVDDTDCGGDS